MYNLNKNFSQNQKSEIYFYFLLYDEETIEYGKVEDGTQKIKVIR
jgi:hypothetical protein